MAVLLQVHRQQEQRLLLERRTPLVALRVLNNQATPLQRVAHHPARLAAVLLPCLDL